MSMLVGSEYVRTLGDVPGHEFHGNQWTAGGGEGGGVTHRPDGRSIIQDVVVRDGSSIRFIAEKNVRNAVRNLAAAPAFVKARVLLMAVLRVRARALGDVPGHEFHGNQWTDSRGVAHEDVLRDKSGEAQTFYHGSVSRDVTAETLTADRTAVRPRPGQLDGIYFTTDQQAAHGYTRVIGSKQPAGRVVSAKLAMKNPLDITKMIKEGQKKGMTFGDAKRAALKNVTSKHDGVIFRGDKYNASEYMVFHPSQIKSLASSDHTPLHRAADAHLKPMTLAVAYAFGMGRKALRASLRTAGDVEGHEFHGNQWTSAGGAGPVPVDSEHIGAIGEKANPTVNGPVAIGPIAAQVYRVGPTDEPEVYFGGTYQDTKPYTSLHEGHEVKAYKVETKNTLAARNHFQLYSYLHPGKTMQDAIYNADKASFKRTGGRGDSKAAWQRVQRTMMRDVAKRGHDSVLFTHPPDPAKTELVIINKKSTSMRSASELNASAAVKAIRAGLLKTLPTALLGALRSGGEVAVGKLTRRRALQSLAPSVDPSWHGFASLRLAGDVEGHEFHGNQWTSGTSLTGGHKLELSEARDGTTTFVHVRMSTGSASNMGRVTKQADGYHSHGADVKISGPHATKSDAVKAVLERSGFRSASIRSLKPQVKGQPHDVKPPFALAFNVDDPNAVKWAREHAAELAKDLSETSERDIRDAIATAMEEGGLDEAEDAILAAVGDSARAEMIARTEIMTAANEGQRQGWEQAAEAGLLPDDAKIQWIATSGCCDDCDALDGEERTLDGEYDDPDAGDGPPLHPNCRCTEGIVG